jgi:hypothetical protein
MAVCRAIGKPDSDLRTDHRMRVSSIKPATWVWLGKTQLKLVPQLAPGAAVRDRAGKSDKFRA